MQKVPKEDCIIPVSHKVYGHTRKVDCEYRFDEKENRYRLWCVETKYGDVELDQSTNPFKPIGIEKLREKYNLEHEDKVIVGEQSLKLFTELINEW